ncbi:MAG: APC family permease [Planctomycetota bacterium]
MVHADDPGAAGPLESLQRRLGFLDVYALAIGSVVGTGIFFLPGKAAAAMGPAAVLALMIGAGLAMLLALCYAEAASRFRGTGGAMRYAQAAFGDGIAFSVGWATWLARVVSWAALGNVFVTALVPLWPAAEGQRGVLTAALFLGLTALNLRGVGFVGRANTALTAAKLVPLLLFVGVGAWWIEPARFVPFAPQGYSGLGATTVLMLYAYVGFEGVVIPAAEMRDPQRNLPTALLLGMATVFVLYLSLWAVCTGTLPGLAGAEQPVGEAAAMVFGATGGALVQAGVAISALGINAFMALVTPRALYSLSVAGLMPPWVGAVGARHVPRRAIVITSAVAFALALTRSFEQLAVISVVARMAQYVPTCLAVMRLRHLPAAPAATFRVWGGPLLPCIAIATCGWLLLETPSDRLLWGALGIAAGVVPFVVWRASGSRRR